MRAILNLLKLQIDNKTNLLKTKSPAKMIAAILKVLIILVVSTVATWFIFFKIFGLGIKINAELIGLVLLIIQLISLLFAIGHIINTLYLNKDNEMLICLPVTPNQLFISKMLFIYLKEVAVNAMISIPIFLSLGVIGSLGLSFYLAIPLFILVLPLLPIIMAGFISIPVMGVIKFLKKHTVFAIVLILLLVAAVLTGYILIVGGIAQSFSIVEKHVQTVRQINSTIKAIGKYIFIYFQMAQAMLSFGKWYYIACFVLICGVLLSLTVLIIRPFYFKTAMSNFENSNTVKKKNFTFKKSSPFVSLMKKEMACIFRSPSEVFEYFLFTLLMPFIVFTYDKLLMSISVNQAGINMIAGSHVMVVAIMAMLSNIVSASAISREGGNFYISKIIPINYYTQIFAKFSFNAIFTIGALLVTMVISFFIYPVWQIILGTLAIIFAAVGHIALSIDMDIKNPTVTFQGDGKSSTTSKSTYKSVICGLIIGFILGIVIILMSSWENVVVPYIIIIAISFIFMIYRIYMLILRINLKYDKIEM